MEKAILRCQRIRNLREECFYAQKQIADYLGVSERTYYNYENGKTQVNCRTH